MEKMKTWKEMLNEPPVHVTPLNLTGPRDYKVLRITSTDDSGLEQLSQALNDGWVIDRTDNAGNSFYIIYVLSKTRTQQL